jgi:ABC-2 type transport system ATP-binding protein
VSLFGDRLHVISDEDVARAEKDIRGRLAKEGIDVLRSQEQRYSLEDVFIRVVERARSQGKVASED